LRWPGFASKLGNGDYKTDRVEPRRNFLIEIMSQHRSLRAASTSGANRNVMKRFERVAVLKKRGQWKSGDRVTGLRKTKADA
jgi:small basic protein (TIGR04137 family)